MTNVTPRQRRILDFIRATVRSRGYPPTVREIGDAVGLTSSSSVHAQLANLEKAGLLRRDPTKPRALELAADRASRAPSIGVPVLGRIAAGAPVLADENVEEYLPVPSSWAGEDGHFALRVSGDSMVGAGILDGDIVVVRSQADAAEGDIVVALLGGPAEDEATVKRFHREEGRVLLLAENAAYAPIDLGDGRIMGKVVAVLRQV